jgi:hypothetical protein
MKNGLKFYAASNGNSLSDDQAKSIATSLVPSNTLNRPSVPSPASNSSIQSNPPPPPPSYNSIINTSSNSLNLQFVFDCYFQKEELKDENQYRCEHCRWVFFFFITKTEKNNIKLDLYKMLNDILFFKQHLNI